jgi:glycosyltransferase involved in cell wall biosynthesis
MRILLTVNCKWWNAAAQGAGVTAKCLLLQGHDVLVQTQTAGPVSQKLSELSLPVKCLVNPTFSLMGLIRSFRPEVIISHRSTGQTIAALTMPRIPLVRVRSDQRKALGGKLWSIVDKRTNLVVFPGASMIRKGFQGPRTGRTAVVPHPVDTDKFNTLNRSEEPLILSLARLSPIKGHKTLIHAMTLVNPDFRAVIAGGEAQYSISQLKDYAGSLGVLHRVEFTGKTDDVYSLLKRARVGVVTSLGSEAVSRTGMEMMASGVPLLAAATNGLCDLVTDGVNGLFHSPGNWKQLAGQINHLIDNPGLAGVLAVNAREHCLTHLSLKAVGQMWTELLEQL